MTAPARQLLTESEAAEALAISVKTLKRLRESGRVPFVPIPGLGERPMIRYDVNDLDAFKACQRKVEGAPCPSTKRKRAASGNTTSSSKVYDFTEARASRKAKPDAAPPKG